MYRDNYKKHIPTCPKTIPVVDQFLWKERDTNQYNCNNGISHTIYDCQGNVHFSLPLDMYPPGGEIHPQIPLSNRMHFNYRMSPNILFEAEEVLKEGYDGGSHTNDMQHALLDQGMFDTRTPGYFRGDVEGYDGGSRTNPIQHSLLDQGMFDTRTPAYFRQSSAERYTSQIEDPDGIMGPVRGRQIPDDRQPTEGYDARAYLPRNTYNQGTYNPGYVRDYPKRSNVPEEGPLSSLKSLQPYNLEHFTPPPPPLSVRQRIGASKGYFDQGEITPFNFCHQTSDGLTQCSEGFSQIPTSSSEFPLAYQSPIMVKGHTMGNPYGNRPGSECKGLYGGV